MSAWSAFSDTVNSIGLVVLIGVLLWKAGLRRVAWVWVGLLVLGVAVPMAMGIMAAAQTVGGLGR